MAASGSAIWSVSSGMSVRAVGYVGIASAILGAMATAWAMHLRVRQVPAVTWEDMAAARQEIVQQYPEDLSSVQIYEVAPHVRVSVDASSSWIGHERDLEERLEAQYRFDIRFESPFHSRYVNDLSSSDVADWLPRAPGDLSGKIEWESGGILLRDGDCLYVENGPLRTLLIFPQDNLVAAFDLRSETLLVSGLAYPVGAKVRFGGNDDIPVTAIPVQPGDSCETDEYLIVAKDMLERAARR